MKDVYKASVPQFMANLFVTILSVSVLAVIALVLVASSIGVLLTAMHEKDNALLFLSGGLLIAALAALLLVVIWKNVNNKALFPSCLCNRIVIANGKVNLMFVLHRSLALRGEIINILPVKNGFWIKWDEGGQTQMVLIRRSVFHVSDVAFSERLICNP